MPPNQNPEQSARDRIDAMLTENGWIVQDRKAIHFNAGAGVPIREYLTDTGPGRLRSLRRPESRRRH